MPSAQIENCSPGALKMKHINVGFSIPSAIAGDYMD